MCDTLLHQLTFKQCEEVKNLTLEQCMIIVEMARIRNFQVENYRKPGETLLNKMYSANFSLELVELYLSRVKQVNQPFRPQTKIAVLVANLNYNLDEDKLVVPVSDCELLNDYLENLGFNVVFLKNLTTKTLKEVLSNIFDVVPKNSYCFVFYAGHGCEVSNLKCILGVDYPGYVDYNHCVTENFVLGQMYKCQPAFCLLMMDMCRKIAECKNKEKIDEEKMPKINAYTIVSCSSLRGQRIEEKVQLVPQHCNAQSQSPDGQSKSPDGQSQSPDGQSQSYNSQSPSSDGQSRSSACQSTAAIGSYVKNSDKYYVYNSSYVKALCNHINERVSVGELLNKAHYEYIQKMKIKNLNLLPTKTEYGFAKRSLHDPAASESAKTMLLAALTKIKEKYYL